MDSIQKADIKVSTVYETVYYVCNYDNENPIILQGLASIKIIYIEFVKYVNRSYYKKLKAICKSADESRAGSNGGCNKAANCLRRRVLTRMARANQCPFNI